MNTKQIAVIIATKDRHCLLRDRVLKSVLAQTTQPSFLVVVDDSVVESEQQKNKLLLESLPQHGCFVQYLINRRAPGASGAWNTAIEFLANQEVQCFDSLFLAFLDDDDEWHPEYLENCRNDALKTNANIVCSGFYRLEGEKAPPIECLPPISISEDLFLRGNPGIQGSNLFLTLDLILMAGGFDEHLSSCTDRDLCIRLCELSSTRYHRIERVLVNHYADSGRPRLSTPNSVAKKQGLSAFWSKYGSRMNQLQREAFLDRALKLFNWCPDTLPGNNSEEAEAIAITLGIDVDDFSFHELIERIKEINYIYENKIVGFNVVLVGSKDKGDSDLTQFIDELSQLGITYYDLCGEDISVELSTRLIAKKNIGHSGWILKKNINRTSILEINKSPIRTQFLSELDAEEIVSDELVESDCIESFQLKIERCRIKSAKSRIRRIFQIDKLSVLGFGSEAVVMSDGTRVFKCIDYWKSRMPAEQIVFLKKNRLQWGNFTGLYSIDDIIVDGTALVLTYLYEESVPYKGGYELEIIDLLRSCSQAGIVCNNLHPKNLIRTKEEIKLIDYGSDIRPWNELGFEHMARRAFLTINHADHPSLKKLMRKSLHTVGFQEMRGYEKFRLKLTGLDRNLKKSKNISLPIDSPEGIKEPFSLVIGVISSDSYKLLPLLQSIFEVRQYSFISSVDVLILCNGCSENTMSSVLGESILPIDNIQLISEAQQSKDSNCGLFGSDLNQRPVGQVGIAHARSMLQKYIGLKCQSKSNGYAWILDDDMRLDARAKQYLEWLPTYKNAGIDVVIGQYEGASPNPPLNGLRGQLVDLVHNLRWLDQLSGNTSLPDRSAENKKLRERYPDYYYDLSRKHTGHIESPFWLEPLYKGETVAEARARLFAYAPLLITGYPLTRSIIPGCLRDPLMSAKDTVNRGGNTLVINADALIKTPNLIPEVNGFEMRRSDMVWAIINKHYQGMVIKTAPFPVTHVGRVKIEQTLNLDKVKAEIMGSALYAGLQEFLLNNPQHKLDFSDQEIRIIWVATKVACNDRLLRLKQSFCRISGITQTLFQYPELSELCEYLSTSFTHEVFTVLEQQVNEMSENTVSAFVSQILQQSNNFASSKLNH